VDNVVSLEEYKQKKFKKLLDEALSWLPEGQPKLKIIKTKICPHCKQPEIVDEERIARYELCNEPPKDFTTYDKWCPLCGQIKY